MRGILLLPFTLPEQYKQFQLVPGDSWIILLTAMTLLEADGAIVQVSRTYKTEIGKTKGWVCPVRLFNQDLGRLKVSSQIL